MYSKIPMPRTEWNEKTFRYMFCFFPLVGVVIGGLVYGALYAAGQLNLGVLFTAAIVTALPVLITGGIHLDGYADTADALASCQPAEKKLEILKDPHTGAFAVIGCCVYFAMYLGAASRLSAKTAPIVCAGFVLSRALAAVMVTDFKPARLTGSAASMHGAAGKNTVNAVSALYTAAAAALMLWTDAAAGGAALACAGLTFLYCAVTARKQFNGVTGDLAGWFLQKCELNVLLGAVAAEALLLWI